MKRHIAPEINKTETQLILDSIMARALAIAQDADENGEEIPQTLRDLTEIYRRIQLTANDEGWNV